MRKFPIRDIDNPLYGWNIGKHYSVSLPSSNSYGYPDISPYTGVIPSNLVPYTSVNRSVIDPGSAIHFYIDDYRFEGVWSYPARALERLSKAGICIGPDFSLYRDWPIPVQMHNWYKNCWCMAFWQKSGIQVIPNVSWSDRRSYRWCFQGLPKGSIVAVSSVGCMRDAESEKLFLSGFEKMCEETQPVTVLIYGSIPAALNRLGVTLKHYPDKWTERRLGNGRERF